MWECGDECCAAVSYKLPLRIGLNAAAEPVEKGDDGGDRVWWNGPRNGTCGYNNARNERRPNGA